MTGQVRVCVIGAGAAGLCAARHLQQPGSGFKATVYEQSKGVGGTWVYSDKVGLDEFGNPVHSSMYRGLKTNLPKEVMAFPDFAFPATRHSFLHHSEVQQYLENYRDHFGLTIQHFMSVRHVEPVLEKEGQRPNTTWKVTVQNVQSGQESEEQFDAVIVCNGHYSVPNLPPLKGLDKFKGQQMHSHDYRKPEAFEGRTVVILGAAASGTDIGLEVATCAKKVYLSHNNPRLPSVLPTNMSQVSGVVSCSGPKEFELSDGSRLEADVILFCTGYHYTFPFLDDAKVGLTIENRIVAPLYKHMIHTGYPSLCFIGIPIQICPFPQFDLQVQLFLKTLSGQLKLPSKEEMEMDTGKEMQDKLAHGVAQKHFHKMGHTQWQYNRQLANMAALQPVPVAVETLYNDVHARRKEHLCTYKKESYSMAGDSYVRHEL